jgi:hypothetical protein
VSPSELRPEGHLSRRTWWIWTIVIVVFAAIITLFVLVSVSI